jgi:hypothetical protein
MYVLSLVACAGLSLFRPDSPSPDGTSASLAAPPAATSATTAAPSPSGPDRLVARVTADVVAGEFPLHVALDASASDRGSGAVRYDWTWGDGAVATSADPLAAHTYVGEGAFDAALALTDLETGEVATASVTIDVSTPGCPDARAPLALGYVADDALEEISGVGRSASDPDALWVIEDSGNGPVLTALDRAGATTSSHELPEALTDAEDLATAIDPATGVPMVFVGDIGDNGRSRDEIVVWVAQEPHPDADGPLAALRMALTYPDGPHDAETLLVDPLTLDLYVVTKDDVASVYVKRAPHDDAGPFVLEALGERPALPPIATGGSVSPDGTRVVVRGYDATAWLWMRDGYRPLEDAFDDGAPCPIGLAAEPQGEAIGFTADGAGLVTVSEGVGPPLWLVGL